MRKDDAIHDLRPALEAVAASTFAWVMSFVALILEVFAEHGFDGPITRGLFNACLRDVLGCFKDAVTARALAAIDPGVALWRDPQRCGFRQRRLRRSPIRFVTRGVFNNMPRGFRARLARLRAMLASIDIWIARVKRRLLRDWSWDAYAEAAPLIARAFKAAPLLVAAHADTS